MKPIKCKAGVLTQIIHNFGRGYPQTFNVKITTESGNEISGIYKEKRHFWIFPQSPVTGKISEKMQFRRYWINGIYSVSIKPDQDVIVQIG